MSVTSTYCALHSFVDFDSSLSLISMNKGINTDQIWLPCLHVMDETPLSCGINTSYKLHWAHTLACYLESVISHLSFQLNKLIAMSVTHISDERKAK